MLRRSKFRPASIDGLPSYGVYRTTILWAIADQPLDLSKVTNPDIEVSVERLPPDVKSPALVAVMFAVDPSGAKNSCAADGSSHEEAQNHPALIRIACDQIMQGFRANPAKDSTGKQLMSVQNALVEFTSHKAK
jgi:hypothetical protein